MKFIIAGAGSVGCDIARHLIKEGKNVIIIEKNPARAKHLETMLDCIVLNREVNNLQVLKDTNIKDGDYFIAVTESDEVNLIACSIASTVKNIKKIARVRNIEYSHAEVFGRPFLGADYVISPEIEAARHIADTIDKGAASDVFSFAGSDVTVRSGIVEKNSFLCNKSLIEIKREIGKQFIVAFIKRDNEAIIPSGKTIIRKEDNIFIVANNSTVNYIFHKLGKKVLKVKNALIIGTTRIALNLLKTLSNRSIKLKAVVKDYEKAKYISKVFPNVFVINDDVRDEAIFEEENLNELDLIVTVTNNQELNVITALYAKSIGISRAIATVNKQGYISIAQKLGVDSTVSPKKSAVDTILKYIRKGNVKTFHSLLQGSAEAVELIINDRCFACNKLVKNLKMPDDSIIAAVTRNGKIHAPDGNFKLQKDDTAVIIMKTSATNKVQTIFADK